jgi:hypothetical protein
VTAVRDTQATVELLDAVFSVETMQRLYQEYLCRKTRYKALVMSVMTYASPIWEL